MKSGMVTGFAVAYCCQFSLGAQICDPGVDCSGHGACQADDTCVCDQGWSGAACDAPICGQPCINGTCTAPDSCTCDSGWTGLTCGNGVCIPNCVMGFCVGPDLCACLDGWMGALCEVPICEPPCVNGVCAAPDICSCDAGYTSPVCDQDVDECLADPCDVNATCTNLVGGFDCVCNTGYVGSGNPGDCTDIQVIPTTSTWGILVMSLLLLVVGTIVLRRSAPKTEPPARFGASFSSVPQAVVQARRSRPPNGGSTSGCHRA